MPEKISSDVKKPIKDNVSECMRRTCGCLKTSEKVKELLKCFPSAPPPSPSPILPPSKFGNVCITGHCTGFHQDALPQNYLDLLVEKQSDPPLDVKPAKSSRVWNLLTSLTQLLQLWVAALALAMYYIIYCYMQMVYYTLRSVMFFHNADGAMKVTIAVVTFTSLVVCFNIILRLERMLGIRWYGVYS